MNVTTVRFQHHDAVLRLGLCHLNVIYIERL